MYLRRIRLLDWKLYGAEHVLEFPAPGKRRNVVLIGAKNGYGKTSLLEAIVLGLYGRDGLDIVARADSTGDDDKRRQSYRRFLESAWNERARHEGRTSMAVDLDFEDDLDGQTISIRRSWNFSVDGRLLVDGEAVTIEHNGKLCLPGKYEDKEDFERSWIAKAALPAHLAQFFLFDGERVQRLAKRDMAAQVRLGIEGFLGVKLMRDLAADLKKYSALKRSEARCANSEHIAHLADEISKLDSRIAAARSSLAEAEGRIKRAEVECDELRGRLAGMSGGAVQNVKRLVDDLSKLEREAERLIGELIELLGGDLALALCGNQLLSSLSAQLQAEQKLAKWQSGLESSKGQVGRFLAAFDTEPPDFVPPLTAEQKETLKAKVEKAWNSIWHPPPKGCAKQFRHLHLTELDRAKVLDRLEQVSHVGQATIVQLLHKINTCREKQDQIRSQVNTYASLDDVIQDLTSKLDCAVSAKAEADQNAKTLLREIAGLEVDLNNKRAEYERENAQYIGSQPLLARAEIAESISRMLGPFIEDAVGEYVADIADRMTEAFRSMAHKTNIERIDIDRNCEVRLLTRSGEDVRTLDQSAGENQVFSFALIAAIAQAADVRFPLVIDTPLARLDSKHRENVLKYFTNLVGEQVFFLSQDTEVVGKYLDAIAPRVAERFLIENEPWPGSKAGRARIGRGKYF
jgi:DNA sulfur modification protein DndD